MTSQTVKKKQNTLIVISYRNKRWGLSLAMSLVFFFITLNPFYAVASHIFFTLCWDWYFFSYKMVQDTEESVQNTLEYKHQPAKFWNNQAMNYVYVRRGAFMVGIFLATWAAYSTKDINFFPFVLAITYGVISFIGIGLCAEKIVYSLPLVGTNQISGLFNGTTNFNQGIGDPYIPQLTGSYNTSQSGYLNTAYGVTGEIIPGFINNVTTASSIDASFGTSFDTSLASSTSTPITHSFE